MSRYIDVEPSKVDEVIKTELGMYDTVDLKEMLQYYPTADVVPVTHAHWIVVETGYLTCSHCNGSFYVGGDVKSQTIAIAESGEFGFCPYCGAKIDEKGAEQ